MKKIYTAIFLLFTTLAITKCMYSQLQLKFISYTNGYYNVSITNPQSCRTDVRINYLNGGLPKDTIVNIDAQTTDTFQIETNYSAGTEIKIKSDGLCSSNGWVSIIVPALQTLPLKLTAFTVEKKPGAVLIKWAAEDIDHVIVERSVDSRSFQKLFSGYAYQMLDMTADEGEYYYRLKLFDALGSCVYSPVRAVRFEKGRIITAVYNYHGQKVANDVHELQKGLYLVKYNDGSTKQFCKN